MTFKKEALYLLRDIRLFLEGMGKARKLKWFNWWYLVTWLAFIAVVIAVIFK